MSDTTTEEERKEWAREKLKELKDATNLPSPKRKKRRIQRGKTVRAMFPNAKFAKKPRMKKTKTHKERRERLKKKARAPNTNKGLLCCSVITKCRGHIFFKVIETFVSSALLQPFE